MLGSCLVLGSYLARTWLTRNNASLTDASHFSANLEKAFCVRLAVSRLQGTTLRRGKAAVLVTRNGLSAGSG
jgi:hypothetical protein